MCNNLRSVSFEQISFRNGVKNRIDMARQRFQSDESGGVVAFTLYLFIIFLMIAGLGIDLMRHEMQRTRLSAAADAAALAGATAPNNAEAKAIIEDYFEKIGMSDHLQAFGEDDVDITLNTAKVTVNTSVDVDTLLMKLVGVDSLTASAESTAEQVIPKLEISLVLDVSGSMKGQKLTDLKVAAKEFVTTILDSTAPGNATISIVPFSTSVTPPYDVYDALTVAETHPYSTCLVFREDEYEEVAIDPSTTYPQQIYTARYDKKGTLAFNLNWRSCFPDPYFRFLPFSSSETALHNKIDSLEARGATSGELGIKWGAALLDPAFQSVAQAVDTNLSNLPALYGERETTKIVVMMGDGANSSSHQFADPNGLLDTRTPVSHELDDFRGPGSDLWAVEYKNGIDTVKYARNVTTPTIVSQDTSLCSNPDEWECITAKSALSYYLFDANDAGPADDLYYDIEADIWLTPDVFNAIPVVPDSDGIEKPVQLTWEYAWGLMSPDYQKLKTGDKTAFQEYSVKMDSDVKNDFMARSCTAAKAFGKGIEIYTIGFEVQAGGTAETELKNCASLPKQNYYYRADENLSISEVFSVIATNITALRLTQ